MNITEICTYPENDYIEYKSQWYWELNDENKGDSKSWGEFIKDILALVNANERSFDKKRYMIIGFDEENKEFVNFGLTDDIFLDLKEKIEEKLKKSIFDYSDIDINFKIENTGGENVILFEISQPYKVHYLIRNIQTKTIDYQKNTILYRSNDGNHSGSFDNVGVMPQKDCKLIEEKIKEKYGLNFSSVEYNTLRNKTIFSTIYSYLEKNKNFRLSDNFPKKSLDSKIFFELYEITSSLDNDDKTYFAYVSDTNIKKSIQGLIDLYSEYATAESKIFLLIDRPKESSSDKRIRYVEQTYDQIIKNKRYIKFIDDFGRDHLYSEYLEPLAFEHNFQNTNNFIESFSSEIDKNQKNIYVTDLLKQWFLKENHPLIVLTGTGGVGKTTVVRNFLNNKLKEIKQDSNTYVLFLDSANLLDKIKSDRVSTIYDLYKAEISDTSQFTEELFKLSIDNGSFIIILDGLDEIISGSSIKFKLQDFLKTIFEDYCFNLAKTKIIVTCRDYIWNEAFSLISESYEIEDVKINPFNKSQAIDFFKSCFKDNDKLQRKSMSIVNNMIVSSNDKYYNPFMLDTVRDLVSNTENKDQIEDIFEIDDTISSKFCLIKNSYLDYLVYAVCMREEKKTGINFSSQVRVLCELSKINKSIDKTDFSFVVKKIIHNADDTIISRLLNHTFIQYTSQKSIIVKYDFLKEFFTKISSAQFLSEDHASLDLGLLSALSNKVSYLNHFSKDIGSRLLNIEIENILLKIMTYIEELNSMIECTDDSINIDKYRFYISNLFILYLGILHSKEMLKDREDLNKALFDIFEKQKNILSKVCLYNIRDVKNTPKILFNFSDATIEECYINNYHSFTDCEFNEKTFFKSGIIGINSTSNYKSNLKPKNISKDIIRIGKTSDFIENIESSLKENSDNKNETLKKFIRLFFKNGRFMPKKIAEISGKRGGNLSRKMLEIQVILIHRDTKLNQEEYKINPKIETDLYSFLDSGVVNQKIKKITRSM